MTQRRRRFKQQLSLEVRLSAWAKTVQQEAVKLPPGPQREAMIRKARQAETASHVNEWANSAGLQPPK